MGEAAETIKGTQEVVGEDTSDLTSLLLHVKVCIEFAGKHEVGEILADVVVAVSSEATEFADGETMTEEEDPSLVAATVVDRMGIGKDWDKTYGEARVDGMGDSAGVDATISGAFPE